MKIYNKTNQIQEVELYDKDMSGNHKSYSIYIQAKSSTEIDARLVSPRLIALVKAGVLETDNLHIQSPKEQPQPKEIKIETPVESKEIITEAIQETEVTEVVETVEAPQVAESDSHICTVCGKEFASDRGLAMHMSKAHPEIDN